MSETTENNNVVDSTTVVGDDDADALFIDEKDIADEVVDEEEATVEDAEDEDNDNDNDDDDDNDNEDNVENVEPARNDSSQQFLEHTDSIYCLATNGEFEDVVISGGGDDVAYLWSLDDGMCAHKLEGHTDSVTACGFNCTGQLAATGALDGTVKVWDCATGELKATLDGPEDGIQWLDWHPKGNVVVAGSDDSSVWMWMANGTFMQMFAGHTGPVTCGRFAPDGKTLCTASEDASVKVWNPKTGLASTTIEGGTFHQDGIVALAVHHSLPLLATGGLDHRVCVSHRESGKILHNFSGHSDSVESVVWSQYTTPYCANWLASGSLDGEARVWDVQTGACVRVLRGHSAGVVRVFFGPFKSAPLLVSVSTDASSCVWNVTAAANSSAAKAEAQQKKQTESSSSDSKPTADTTSTTANAATIAGAAPRRVLLGHSAPILAAAISKSGKYLVTGGDDQACLVFDTLLNKDSDSSSTNELS